ncbi:stalk domain-containing protein [Anaerotignum sp.]
MKKKLAALLCGVMCVTAFTGCSRTELAYLKMSSDLMDTMTSCAVEGTMQADIDFDALDIMLDDVAKATGVENDGADNGLDGKKSLKVDYDMNMKIDTLEYDMAFDVTYNGKSYDLGKLYYSLDKGVYVTSDTLWGAYQIYGDMAGAKDQYIMSEAFAQDFKEILAEERYIELVSMEQLTGVNMDAVMPEQNMTELYDAVYTFYEDVLDGFETGMVKEINGGYQIKANGHEVAQLLADLLHFVADNPDQVIDATEAYMMAVMDSVEVGTPEETAAAKAEMAALFAEGRASRDDFVAAAEQMAVLVESLMQYPGADIVLDSFDYVATVKKAGNSYDSVAAYTVKHDGKMVCSLVTDSVLKKEDVQIFFPVTAMTVEELEGKLAKLEDKYNPVTGVSVTWGMYGGGSDYADIHTMRSVAEGAYFGSNYNWSEMIIENGRAYLPLRVIAETLGEEVGWENSTKTPYVVQNGERIDMKGKLQNDRAFVGIRDFEKLGYTVTYMSHKDEFDSYFDYKEVVIEK